MLFNSYTFIFGFLPIVAAGFYALDRINRHWAIAWLGIGSFFFYGWWDWHFLPLLGLSALFNFALGTIINQLSPLTSTRARSSLLAFAIAVNLAALAYFKYTNFLLDNLNLVLAHHLQFARVVLPIGISFFTFTQIAFLVDIYERPAPQPRLADYLLFVTYFPHLIAGPILHHKEMMPQFARSSFRSPSENIAVGLAIFVIGLFKKVVIADGVAHFATPVFLAASQGTDPSLLEAWGGALAYTFQLYFDFSGYSDMAVGLSRLLGIRLPLNFDSPYKATSIIDFWRRWHMTLSRFLRDYLYIPLGGNKKGILRRYVNLMITMLLGGLWHGAGWNFLIWGGLHGIYLVVNNIWRVLRRGDRAPCAVCAWCARALTFLAVVIGWVFFRANSVGAAWLILKGMAGFNGLVLPVGYLGWLGRFAGPLEAMGVRFETSLTLFSGASELGYLFFLLVMVWCLPNTQQIMGRYRPALELSASYIDRRLVWRPSLAGTAFVAILAIVSLLSLSRVSAFLYFQF